MPEALAPPSPHRLALTPPSPHRVALAPWRTRRRGLVVALVLATTLGACGGEPSAGSPDAPDGTWTLVEGVGPDGEVELTDDAGQPIAITLTIDGGDWGGTVCNHYGGRAEVQGDQVRVHELAQTEMACMDDGLMDAERTYLAAFGAVRSFAFDDGRLTLTGGADTRLVYDPVPPTPDAPLAGTTWRLDTLIDGATATSVAGAPTLRFAEDGTFEADDGCGNRLDGEYELTPDELRLSEVVTTDQACPPDLAAQGEHVQRVLGDGPVDAEIAGDQLTLSADGLGLLYRAGD